MSNNGSYSNDTTSGVEAGGEFANDPASGSFFSSDYKKHEDLKSTLDGNKDGLKLEAMKRIIGMIAKGKDASDLFPAVVKNVVSKNIEVKKLVYVYLVRYAEEQQDLALLSISTFQRALKDPNQLIRASALRVLSSIRVPVIVPIMVLAIKDAVNDMSPYVRKTAAHAIPKLYSLDPEQKDQLIDVIEKLLYDKTTLVVGSAVMAFEEVCPERIDLIHKNYRKLCTLLVDVEEWGQVIIINMLTRYARTQFTDPNECGEEGPGIDSESTFYEDEDENEQRVSKKPSQVMDPDHRMLLRNTKPLLQSRNASVVLAVAQLYYYIAPKAEVGLVVKALIRLLRHHREVQSVVLSNIATMSTKRKGMFEPYLKSFFVRSSDPTHIKQLKLEILTNLATEANISLILRELQTYICSSDKEFVAATVQAIGRCARGINEVAETCLNGLVTLLSNRDEAVVAESVVVIKNLLQMKTFEHSDIISHMARLIDNITVPMARASIVWLLGEYFDRVPKIAPDVLRKMAKTFPNEEDIVKLQVLTLATKLYLTNPKQTKLLTQYVFNLAKYDTNYDIRDRVRFLRQLIFPAGDKDNSFTKHAKKIILSMKPAPLLESKFKDRDQYQLASLSHFINARACGYHDLPEFPKVAPDPSVRNVNQALAAEEEEVISTSLLSNKKKKKIQRKKSFYSESDSSYTKEKVTRGAAASSDEDSSDSSSDSDSSSEDSSEDSIESGSDVERPKAKRTISGGKGDFDKIEGASNKHRPDSSEASESEASSSEESSASESDSASNSSDSVKVSKKPAQKKISQSTAKTKPAERKNIDLLLDLGDDPLSTSTLTPTVGINIMTPVTNPVMQSQINALAPSFSTVSIPTYEPTEKLELLDRLTGQGLVVQGRFTRRQNLYSPKMTSIELTFTNQGEEDIKKIRIGNQNLGIGMEMHTFPEIELLSVGQTLSLTIGIDFNESTQPAKFDTHFNNNKASLTIKSPMGEMMQGLNIAEADFITNQNKLKGMNEHGSVANLSPQYRESKALIQKVHELANIQEVVKIDTTPNLYRFAAQTLSSKVLVLITLRIIEDGAKVNLMINCEKMVVGSMLVKEIKAGLST